jgi:hypothetical protein
MIRSFVNCGIPEYILIQAISFKLRYYKVLINLPYLKILLQYCFAVICGSMILLAYSGKFFKPQIRKHPRAERDLKGHVLHLFGGRNC